MNSGRETMLRIVKILLVLAVALWGLLGAFGNVTDWAGTRGAVAATTTMSTFDAGEESWRATSSPLIITAGAIFIPTMKILSSLFCFAGAARMGGAVGRDAATFQASKALALTGCAIAMLLLFLGWVVIGETWFELWRSDIFRELALDSAFRYFGMIGVIALFVAQREE